MPPINRHLLAPLLEALIDLAGKLDARGDARADEVRAFAGVILDEILEGDAPALSRARKRPAIHPDTVRDAVSSAAWRIN